MKKIFIWLDDERKVPDKWLEEIKIGNLELAVFKKAEDLMQWYKDNENKYDKIFISFDHDLGNGLTGYNAAVYIAEKKLQLDGFTVHSMNPTGRKNIFQVLCYHGYNNLTYISDILN